MKVIPSETPGMNNLKGLEKCSERRRDVFAPSDLIREMIDAERPWNCTHKNLVDGLILEQMTKL
jgi:hypothetical protein